MLNPRCGCGRMLRGVLRGVLRVCVEGRVCSDAKSDGRNYLPFGYLRGGQNKLSLNGPPGREMSKILPPRTSHTK